MRKFLTNPYVVLAARVIVGGVFIYASLDKIQNPAAFSDAIDNYQFTPSELSNIFSLYVPILELVLGVMLISGIFLRGSTLISLGLMLFFILLMSRAVILGIDTHCGCFKAASNAGAQNYRQDMIMRIWEDVGYVVLLLIIQLHLWRENGRMPNEI